MLNTPNGVTVYVIWYGDFSTWPVPQPTPSVVTIVERFLRNIGGTPRWAMVTQWADSTGIPPVNKLTFGGSYFDTAMSQGTYISACGTGHRTIQDVIEHAIANGIPRDPHAIYCVLPRGDVVTDDCNHSQILAWHSNYGDGLGHKIMYAYLTAITGSPWGPPYLQDDWWTDYVMQAVMHEIEETMIWPYPDVLYQSSWMDSNTQPCIRLNGIDCPETGQPFGTRAKQFTGDLAFGKTVTIRVRDTDRYGRTVADVILRDGPVVNHEVVRAGLAWWYRKSAPYDKVIEDLEQEAREAKQGL